MRYLRAQDLREGLITSSDPVYISRNYYESVARSHIRPGYLLFSIMGSVGNQAIVPDGFPEAIANRAVGILVPKGSNPILTRFLFQLFLTDLGAQLYGRVKKGGLQKRANLADIEALQFPLVPEPHIGRIVASLDSALAARRQHIYEADDLLTSLDGFVLGQLDLSLTSPSTHRSTYAVRVHDVIAGKRLYPDYFHPERINAIKSVQARYPGERSARLMSIADFYRDQRQVEPDNNYLGLANVQPNTGERIEGNDEDRVGTVFAYAKDDVLFARLRPYLNKVYRADRRGVCSTEFHVLRIRKNADGKPSVLPDYLAAVLRSSIVLAQTRHMMTGNTHPRLANEDVVNLVVPVPPDEVQETIAAEVDRLRKEARRLRAEAVQLWDNAKRRFEEQLIGPAIPLQKGGH